MVSDLGLCCLHMSNKKDARLIRVQYNLLNMVEMGETTIKKTFEFEMDLSS